MVIAVGGAGRGVCRAGGRALAIAMLALLSAVRPAAAQEPAKPEATAEQAAAQSQPVSAVVELFTSQGCSSCPPADSLFRMFVDRRDVVALSLPVDYWDYLGWKDTLASTKNSQRQRDYARERGDGAVYTPQIVVNGRAHAVGSDQSQIERQIARTSMEFAQRRVPMRFWRTNAMMVVEAAAASEGTKPPTCTIWLAAVQEAVEVEIARGENRGRKVKYLNVVHELVPIGSWNGAAVRIQLATQTIMRPGMSYAVLLQEGSTGPMLGAAWLGG